MAPLLKYLGSLGASKYAMKRIYLIPPSVLCIFRHACGFQKLVGEHNLHPPVVIGLRYLRWRLKHGVDEFQHPHAHRCAWYYMIDLQTRQQVNINKMRSYELHMHCTRNWIQGRQWCVGNCPPKFWQNRRRCREAAVAHTPHYVLLAHPETGSYLRPWNIYMNLHVLRFL